MSAFLSDLHRSELIAVAMRLKGELALSHERERQLHVLLDGLLSSPAGSAPAAESPATTSTTSKTPSPTTSETNAWLEICRRTNQPTTSKPSPSSSTTDASDPNSVNLVTVKGIARVQPSDLLNSLKNTKMVMTHIKSALFTGADTCEFLVNKSYLVTFCAEFNKNGCAIITEPPWVPGKECTDVPKFYEQLFRRFYHCIQRRNAAPVVSLFYQQLLKSLLEKGDAVLIHHHSSYKARVLQQ
ncbi:hypothetical protein HDU98_009579 [Podochytrium sp. JEL0797]|nr:hypothetical protein HDU98_009579 [Podochytrium sp. JEL0797]